MKFLYRVIRCKKYRPLFSNYVKHFSIAKMFNKEKYALTLDSDLEKSLESGDSKHRKHPGTVKTKVIQLPEYLISAFDEITSDYSNSFLMTESEKLYHYLESRRLPIELQEVERRMKNIISETVEESDSVCAYLDEKQTSFVKKRLNCELKRWKPLEYTHHLGVMYLVSRLASNYASVTNVLNEIESRLPSFHPKSFFDFGSGVGSALWAAHSKWGNNIKEYFCVDVSCEMNEISQQMLKIDKESDEVFIKNVFYRQFLPESSKLKYDLVVSAFSLLDLPSMKDRLRIIDTLWRKTNNILVVIESGNKAGFSAVSDVRDYILQMENRLSKEFSFSSTGAHVLSPCAHDLECPLKTSSDYPCGRYVFYQSIFPSHKSNIVKKHWISYVVLCRGHRPEENEVWPRIVKPVLSRSRHVICHLCCSDGNLKQVTLTKTKNGRHAYRCAKSSTVGDRLPMSLSSKDGDCVSADESSDSDTENDVNL